jgi:phage recombination protein Bet
METKTAVAKTEDRTLISYEVAGQEVKLSYQIVRSYLTKGAGQVTDQDIVQFMSICKYNQLNPFLNEAYLVKYGTAPASMIVSKEALMKRAEECKTYEGIQAGIIVLRDNAITELEGCFFLETDTLVGGWAKVYRSDRKYPIVARVNLSEYDKKQALWNEKKSTMISKVAKVQALREAFPTQLGAMYTAEEQGVIDIQHEELSSRTNQETVINQQEPESKPEGTSEQKLKI